MNIIATMQEIHVINDDDDVDCLIPINHNNNNNQNNLNNNNDIDVYSLFTNNNNINIEPSFMSCDTETFFKCLSSNDNKQDVSIGTDLTISRDLRFKKDYETFDCLNRLRPAYNTDRGESFKLIEKIQPKKSRTKYSKDQIEVLEGAYSRNPYPDVITVEQLCKALDISREKVNIWFQNRRARTKRTTKPASTSSSNSSNTTHAKNNIPFGKVYKPYSQSLHMPHQQPTNLVFINGNVANLNGSYYSTQPNFNLHRPAHQLQIPHQSEPSCLPSSLYYSHFNLNR